VSFHIVVSMEGGTRLALAAYSTLERAEAHVTALGKDRPARVDFFEPGPDAPPAPRMIYAAQRKVRDGVYELGGYFFSRWEAERAVAGNGFERRLEIDVATAPEAPPTETLEAPAALRKGDGTEAERRKRDSAPPVKRPTATKPLRAPVPVAPPRQIALLVVLLGALAAVIVLFVRTPGAEVGTGRTGVELPGSPPSAVDFFRQGRFVAFEFPADETVFRAWLSRVRPGAVPDTIPGDGFPMPRYVLLASITGASGAAGGTDGPGRILLQDGLYWTTSEGGTVTTVAWDRVAQRAYYYGQ
jgi:hypothetical protein